MVKKGISLGVKIFRRNSNNVPGLIRERDIRTFFLFPGVGECIKKHAPSSTCNCIRTGTILTTVS